MKEKCKNFFNKVLDVIFPNDYKCIFCQYELPSTIETRTCDNCEKTLPRPNGKICLTCGMQIHSLANYCVHCKDNVRYFTAARAPFHYKKPITIAITNMKYENAKYLFKPLAAHMAKCFFENNFKVDFIVPVPLFLKKEKQRGYNQAMELAKELSKFIGIPVRNDFLARVKNTPTQTELTYNERQKNLKDSFKALNNKEFKNHNLLLIDDVLTTGATINNCSKILKNSGAKNVYALTLARTQGDEK